MAVKLLITGYEHSGTTLLSDILRNNGYESGFECGVLLASTPEEFHTIQPFWDMVLPGWGITPDSRAAACQGDFAFFYASLCRAAFPDHKGPFFDKTPKYMSNLGLCLHRAPFIRQALVLSRDPRAVLVALAKRMNPNRSPQKVIENRFEKICDRYLRYFIGSCAHLDSDQVLFVAFEDFVSEADQVARKVAEFVDLEAICLKLPVSRFPKHVASGKINAAKAVEFEQYLTPEMQTQILDKTRLAAPFFATREERIKYGDMWLETKSSIRALLQEHGLTEHSYVIDGRYFEPMTYVLRNPNILESRENPLHLFGKSLEPYQK